MISGPRKKVAFSLLLVSILLFSSLIAASPSLLQPAHAVALLTISPSTGAAGAQVTLVGSGFDSFLDLKIYFDDVYTSEMVSTDASGSFTRQFSIPTDAAPGDHTVTAKLGLANTEKTQASAIFTVEGLVSQPPSTNNQPASISIHPKSGKAGTEITITGINFDPSIRLTVYFDSKSTDVHGFSDQNGNFGPVTITVPTSAAVGSHEISVQEGIYANTDKTKATTFFEVTESAATVTPSISVSKSSGPIGTPVTVILKGFGASKDVSIYFDQQLLKTVRTSSGGTATDSVIIPASAKEGQHTISAQLSTGEKASTEFTVTVETSPSPAPGPSPSPSTTGKASLSLAPSSGAAGSTVTVSGKGFDPSISLKVLIDGTFTGVIASTSQSGTFSTKIVIPTGTAVGDHTIIAQEGTYANGPTTAAATTFVVTQSAPAPTGPSAQTDYAYLVLNPNKGPAGSKVLVKGFNFDPYLTLKIAIDDTVTDIIVQTDGSGKLEAEIQLPIGLEKGDHSVIAQYSIYANTFHTKGSATFTVTESLVPEGMPGGTYAAINITPREAPKGATVIISGVRFDPNITLKMYVDDIRTDFLITADPSGSFAFKTKVPNDLSLGTHTMTVALNAFANTVHTKALTQFTVLEGVEYKPTVRLDPAEGSAGTVVQVSGTGFSSADAFRAIFGTSEAELQGLVPEVSGGLGEQETVSFSAKFVVPALSSSGSVKFRVTDANRFAAETSFNYKSTEGPLPGEITDFPTGAATSYNLGDPIVANVPVKVNILLMGFPKNSIGEDIILAQLPSEYTQVNRIGLDFGRLTPYATYKYDYEISYLPYSVASEYADFIKNNHQEQRLPQLQGEDFSFWSVNADLAEAWIMENADLPQEGYTVIFVNTQGVSELPNYYYNAPRLDPDTKEHFGGKSFGAASFMIGYGGTHRFQVIDFSAGPTFYGGGKGHSECLKIITIIDQITNEEVRLYCLSQLNGGIGKRLEARPDGLYEVPITGMFIPTPSELGGLSPEDLSTVVGMNARAATILRFVPSTLYDPIVAGNFLVDIKIFSDDPTRKFSNYVNATLVEESLRILEPRAQFTVTVEEMPLDSIPELKKVVVGALAENGVIDDRPIDKYLRGKITELSPPSFVQTVVPVYVFGGYEFGGYLGKAAWDDKGDFGYVAIGTSGNYIDTNKRGLSNVIAHELTHAFGLTHPHDGYDNEFGEITYNPYDFSNSVLTYALYNNLPDRMDYDNRDRANTFKILAETSSTLSATKTLLEQNGFNNTPEPVKYRAEKAIKEYDYSVTLYKKLNPDYYGASIHALSAWRYSLVSLLLVPGSPNVPIEGDIRISADKTLLSVDPDSSSKITVSVKNLDSVKGNDVQLNLLESPPGFEVNFGKEKGQPPFASEVSIKVASETPPGKYYLKIFAEKDFFLDDVTIEVDVADRGQGVKGPAQNLFPDEPQVTVYPENTIVYYDIPVSGAVQPYKIAVDSTGKIWFSERNFNRITMLDPAKDEMVRWGRSGTAVTDVVAQGKYVYYLYGAGVVRFDATGGAPYSGVSWLIKTSTQSQELGDLCEKVDCAVWEPWAVSVGLESFSLTPDGRYVWMVSSIDDMIAKLDTQTSTMKVWALPSTESLPVGIAVDVVAYKNGKELVWITEQDGNAVASFDGLSLTEYRLQSSGTKPTGIVIVEKDRRSQVWFTEQGTGRLTMLDPDKSVFTRYDLPSIPATLGFMKTSDGSHVVFTHNEGVVTKVDTRNPGLKSAVSDKVQPIVTKLKGTETDVPLYELSQQVEDLETLKIKPRTASPRVSGQNTGAVMWDIQDDSVMPFSPTVDLSDNIWFTMYRANSVGYISSGKSLQGLATFIEGSVPPVVKEFLESKVVVTNISTGEVIRRYMAVQTVPDKYAEQVLGIRGQYVTTIAFEDRPGRSESNNNLNVFIQISHTDSQVNSARGVQLGGDTIQIAVQGKQVQTVPTSQEIGLAGGSASALSKSQDASIKLSEGQLMQVIKEFLDGRIDVLNETTGENLIRFIHVQTVPDKYAAEVLAIQGQYVTTIAFQDRYGRSESNGDLNVFIQISHTDSQVNSARGVQLGGDSVRIIIGGKDVGQLNRTLEVPVA